MSNVEFLQNSYQTINDRDDLTTGDVQLARHLRSNAFNWMQNSTDIFQNL